jgi:Leucine-rich repeat (LRR) protein
MEATAISAAKSALSAVVKLATSAITSKIGLLLGVQKELFFITEELEMMQAFLRTATTEEVKGETVNIWVRQVQELAYDVEDCLQEASVHLMKQGRRPAMFSCKLAQERINIAKRIQVLKVRIEDVSKRNLRYGLIKSNSTNAIPPDVMEKPMSFFTANEEALLVGLSKQKKELLNLIFEDHDTLKVILVTGMGGLGKTTLVRYVYGSNELSDVFECFAWVTMVHPFNIEEFVVSLAKQLSLVDYSEDGTDHKKIRRFNLEEMQNNVIEHLKHKKYVIVIDDLADETEWKMIKNILLNESKGSRIIVNTRSESLEKSISQSFLASAYMIHALSKEDLLDLFYRAVFKNSDRTKQESVKSGMECEAYKIIERCGKLPLAVVTIGSFLATRPKTSDVWQEMHHHISSEIDSNPHLESIKTVLTTSYDGLSYHLKSCFLYLSVFHNHQEIRRSRIVRRWMAEGFLVERRDMTAEEVGERYFYDLMGRSLIQPSDNTIIGNDSITRFNIHDLLYEMIVAKVENENVALIVGDRGRIIVNSKARHVVMQDWQEEKNNYLGMMMLSQIRSLTMFGKVGSHVAYDEMRLLRVLDLEGTLGLKNRDLSKIGKLRHLKYLGLRRTTITELPGSLKKLQNLETLDIRDTWVLELPRGIVELQKLSYLRAGTNYNILDISGSLDEVGATCGVLLHLYFIILKQAACCVQPSRAASLCPRVCTGCTCSNPCCEAFDECYNRFMRGSFGVVIPKGINKLRCLRNLGMVDIGESKDLAMELKCLTNLTKLAITSFSEKNGKILGEVIEGIIYLKSLVLSARDELGLSCCLESIHSPPKYLKSLKLFSSIANKLPDWFSSLDNLVKLYFKDTLLKMENIEVIGRLSNLKILFIGWKAIQPGEQMLRFGPNAFPMLQVMSLDWVWTLSKIRNEIIKVSIEETALPKLAHLKIRHRESMIQDLKDGIEGVRWRMELEGLESLRNLKEIVLDDTSVDFVKSVQDMISRIPTSPKPGLRCISH